MIAIAPPLPVAEAARRESARKGVAGRTDATTRPALRMIRIDGKSARYLLGGSGPPLLVIASPLVLARSYLPAVRALAPWFTVVVVELPGAGGSDRIQHAWSFARYADWTLELVRRMPLAKPIVVGHAGSGPVALELARRAPDEVRALALVGPCGARGPRSTLRIVVGRARDALREPGFALRVAPHLVANAIRHRRTFFEHVRAAAHADIVAAARDIRIPALLAWGDRDDAVPLADASRLGRALPSAKLVVGAGSHDWIATAPDAFAAALRRFAAGI